MNNKEKKFTVKNFFLNYVIIEFLVINVIISLTDKIGDVTDIDFHLLRLVPLFLLTLLLSFLVIKLNAKRIHKNESKEFKESLIILPIIVAVLTFLWGIYSVHVNMEEIKSDVFFSIYSNSEIYGDFIKDTLEDVRNEAIGFWVLTSICYLIPSEAMSLIMRKKVDAYFLDDLTINENPEALYVGEGININPEGNGFTQGDMNQDMSNIKWDL